MIEVVVLYSVCVQGSEDNCTPGAEPRPPPRYKRKVKMRGIENLNLDNINVDTAGAAGAAGAGAAGAAGASGAAGTAGVAGAGAEHQNDILFPVCSSGRVQARAGEGGGSPARCGNMVKGDRQ